MKILGIDYGTKRIGLAWSDTTLGMVLPYGTVKNLEELAKLVNQEKPELVVIGWPVAANGTENKNTERVKTFGYELGQLVDAEITFSDERFSSQAADAAGGGVSRDEKSAMIILDGYLKRNKK